jgi:hypothetical protein
MMLVTSSSSWFGPQRMISAEHGPRLPRARARHYADWWARVVQARTEREGLLPQRVWALRKGEHEAVIDMKAVPGLGAEIVLTVDGEWRKTRLFRSHEQAELVGAIADTRAMFEGKGWRCDGQGYDDEAWLALPAVRLRVDSAEPRGSHRPSVRKVGALTRTDNRNVSRNDYRRR